MESDDEDIDIQDLDIDDVPPHSPSSQTVAPQQPPVISGLSTIFKAKRTELENGQQMQAAGGSSSSSSNSLLEENQRSGSQRSFSDDTSAKSRHPKRKSDESYPAHSPAGASSSHMARHGRSSSSSSNNSDNGRAYGLMNAEDRWNTSSSFSPSLRAMYVPGTSPSSSSPAAGFDSYLSRRRSLGHGSNSQLPQPGHSSYSPSSSTSPTYSSFAHYHNNARASPSMMASGGGGQSPAFGASSPPINLPLHAHLHQTHPASTEEVIAHLSYSPHAHAELTPCPPPDADEPWIDLPPSLDATIQSPLQEHGAFSPHHGPSRSPVVIPADVNLERRRSDPSGLPRSPATRAARKANSSPARVPLRLSLSHSGQSSNSLLDNSGRRTTSPSTIGGQHQRGRSTPETSTIRSPRSLPTGQSPTGQWARRPASFESESSLLLSRQRSHSPSASERIPPLSISPGSSLGPSQRSSTSPRTSPLENGFPARTSSLASTSPQYSPSQGETTTESPIEMDLSSEERDSAEGEATRDGGRSSFFSSDAKLFPPAPNHDLSLPPRSGWELSDDTDDSPPENRSMEDAHGSFDISHESSLEEHDQDSAELRPDMSPSSPTMGTIPLPLMDADEDKDKSPEWGAPLDFNRGPAVELETLSPEEVFETDPEVGESLQAEMDEEGLTPLERIFLFAKSEHANHRETVSRMLPIWLEEVEICEAVDYILPLFQGLIQDEDYVKEAFASSLDSLMWYFYSHCPLVELSAQHEIIKMSANAEHEDHMDDQLRTSYKEGETPNIAVSEGGLQLFKPSDAGSTQESFEAARHAFQDARNDIAGLTPVSGTTLVEPDSGNTMLGNDEHDDAVEVADRPLLPLDTFHSIMAALLMNEVSTVSAVAQEAIVRFVQLLEDKTAQPAETSHHQEEEAGTPRPGEEGKRLHIHRHYDLPDRARLLIRDDLINEIVLALFRLDEKPVAFASLFKEDTSQSRGNITMPEDSSSKFSHFFDDPMASMSPASHEDPDAQQGVFVGLTMVAMLAETNCLPVELVETKLLFKATACARDPLIVLKKQAVEVLASLCKAVSDEAVTSHIAPIVMDLSEDSSPTIRRTIAALLPEVVSKVIPEDYRRDYAVTLSDTFCTDLVAMVRQAFLEISGPLIYIFKDDVPEPLIDHFIGFMNYEPAAPAKEEEADNNVFAPLIPAFASTAGDVFVKPSKKSELEWNVQDDHGRAIITAYNLPGVVLSVGEKGWPELRRLHATLALDSTISQPRYLIASSIHDVAKAIGEEQAANDLVPIFKRLAADDDLEVVMRAFERYPEFLAHLPSSSMQDMTNILSEAWNEKAREDWRLREVLAEGLVAIAKEVQRLQQMDGLLAALKEGLYDRFTAVRTWATKAVPHFWLNTADSSVSHYRVSSTLWSLSEEGHHKHRATYCLALAEMVEADAIISIEHCERLAEMAEDRVVDVRLMAARCLAKAVQPGKQFSTQRPREITTSLLSLLSDSSASVRDEMRGVNPEMLANWAEEDVNGTRLHEHSSDSSEDEDEDASPRFERRPSDGTTKTMPGSYRKSSGFNNETTQSSSTSYTNGFGSNSTSTSYNQNGDDDNDSDDSDNDEDDDDLDLDSSTIYEIDLEDLASSTSQLPSKLQENLQYARRDTPPLLRNQSSNSLFSNSRLASTSTPPPPSTSRPCQLERPSSASSWHFSMREEEQYVAIDVTGHA